MISACKHPNKCRVVCTITSWRPVKLSQWTVFQLRMKKKPMITSCLLTASILHSWATTPRFVTLLLPLIPSYSQRPEANQCFIFPVRCGGIHLQLPTHCMTCKQSRCQELISIFFVFTLIKKSALQLKTSIKMSMLCIQTDHYNVL